MIKFGWAEGEAQVIVNTEGRIPVYLDNFAVIGLAKNGDLGAPIRSRHREPDGQALQNHGAVGDSDPQDQRVQNDLERRQRGRSRPDPEGP